MSTNEMETPTGYALSPQGYTELAAQARVAGSPIAGFFLAQAHKAACALEQERFTARRVIAAARVDAEAAYEEAWGDYLADRRTERLCAALGVR
jgi:hypothetical protein